MISSGTRNMPATTDIEVQFATILKEYQLKTDVEEFDIIGKFKSLCAQRALAIGTTLEGQEVSAEFDHWDLETKLWHLVELLSSFRLSRWDISLLKEYEMSSLGTKQENYLRQNPQIIELYRIIEWLQTNTRNVDTEGVESYQMKWNNTRLAVVNKDYDILLNNIPAHNLVDTLDVDSPLRSNKSIHPHDEAVDSTNFHIIYKLVLANRVTDALEIARNTGNYALALILLGYTQTYYDPIIDKRDEEDIKDINDGEDGEDGEILPSIASGTKHKLLWTKAVYKLSQQPNLNKYERLIYSYLSGGDVSANLSEAADDWAESLLIYTSQLYTYKLQEFMINLYKDQNSDEDIPSIVILPPQLTTLDDILNALSKSGTTVSQQSQHPLRVISGSIMIDKVSSLLHNLLHKHAQDNATLNQPHLTRVLTHLAIFKSIIGGDNPVLPEDLTTIITLYIAQLSDSKLTDLIPIYLSFIPDEKDAREAYSLLLSTITDYDERLKQIEISKRINDHSTDVVMLDNTNTNNNNSNNNNQDKMINVLRRTVERVLSETESYYRDLQSSASIEVQESEDTIDDMDYKLYRSVEYFYENNMYEDAISATVTIIRRFLLCGKLSALKQFAKGKSFKSIINNYDVQLLAKEHDEGHISEETKLELLEYSQLLEALILIDDWRNFASITNDTGKWKSSAVSNSIEKTSKTLTKLIFDWFKGLSHSDDKAIYTRYRAIYVPYLIIELLEIYQNSRLNDWKYMRQVFTLINQVANEEDNDFLECFQASGRLQEFLVKVGEISVVASERGIQGVFY
ncbi:nuclear pore protein 84/107 [Scheffersomyces amazonensis]|uniref:nuclear pore protein 84/107 n=1 Tax=Scheffersomyces amazonensis TaxID=1078765 RepID=UPI00315C5FDC